MKLESIDEVARLRGTREQATALASRASHALLDEWAIWNEGARISIFGVISAEYLRQAIIEGCHDRIVDIDRRLTELGVAAPRHDAPDRDIAGLRRDLEMYVRAWIRELGGSIRNKAHLIDALVLTTRELRERAEKAEEELRKLSQAVPSESDRSAA